MTHGIGSLYEAPYLYQLAFSYRDFPTECQFLLDAYERINGTQPSSFLELAAGPADHAIEMSKTISQCAALDLSPAMLRYGQIRVQNESSSMCYYLADMSEFQLSDRFDLVATMLDSACHLLTNEAFRQHLDCVADVLNTNGLYTLEMSHPADVFGQRQSTHPSWSVQDENGSLAIDWHQRLTTMDPLSQRVQADIKLLYTGNDGASVEILDQSWLRLYTATELEALVHGNGRFEIVEIFGTMNVNVPFSNAGEAWRMIPVLRKVR